MPSAAVEDSQYASRTRKNEQSRQFLRGLHLVLESERRIARTLSSRVVTWNLRISSSHYVPSCLTSDGVPHD